MHDNLIILAGGASSRMKKPSINSDLTEDELRQSNQLSKGLISIDPNGRPLLDYLLFNAKKAGYKNIIIVIGSNGRIFKEQYGLKMRDNYFHGLRISYALQEIPAGREKPLGTADAVYQALEQYPELQSDTFTVCNSDNLYSVIALSALRQVKSENALIAYEKAALGFTSERVSRFAVLKIENNTLLNIIEKPNASDLDNYRDEIGKIRISMNIFKFSGKSMFKYFKNCPIHPERNEKEIPTALMNYITEANKKITTIPISESVPDLTSKEDIPKLKDFINKHYGQLKWDDKT